MEERLDEADLLAVAARELAERPIEVGLEALGEPPRAAEAASPAARRRRQTISRPVRRASRRTRPAGCRGGRGSRRLSRRLSRPKTRARPRVGCSRSSSVRIVVVLPAPLGPRKPNTSPRLDLERDVLDAAVAAVALGQRLGLDDRRHGAPLVGAQRLTPGSRALDLPVLERALGVGHEEAVSVDDVEAAAAQTARDPAGGRAGYRGAGVATGVERRCAEVGWRIEVAEPFAQAGLPGRPGASLPASSLAALAAMLRLIAVDSPCMWVGPPTTRRSRSAGTGPVEWTG